MKTRQKSRLTYRKGKGYTRDLGWRHRADGTRYQPRFLLGHDPQAAELANLKLEMLWATVVDDAQTRNNVAYWAPPAEAAHAAFASFLQDRSLTPPQIRFVEMLVDQLTARGVMNPAALYEPPFNAIHAGGPDDATGLPHLSVTGKPSDERTQRQRCTIRSLRGCGDQAGRIDHRRAG